MAEENQTTTVPPATPTQGTPPATEPAEQPKYTDKQLNDLIAKESGKRQEKATADLLAKMGFKSIEEVEAFNKTRQESMTQAEKDRIAISEKETALAAAQADAETARYEAAAARLGVPETKIDAYVKHAKVSDGVTPIEKMKAYLDEIGFKTVVQAPQNVGLVTGQQGMNEVDRLLDAGRRQAGLIK